MSFNEQIISRFFYALEYLKAQNEIHGIATFAKRYDIDRRNLAKIKANPAGHTLRTYWLSYLVSDYNVSAHWLLTGEGDMRYDEI